MGVNDNQELEFIELKNTGTSTLNMKGLRFADGISYLFTEEMALRPQEFIVLASNGRYFRDRYGFWPYASFDGQLDNGGERIVLLTADRDTVCSFLYSDGPGWPESPDGDGNSLVPTEYNPDNNQDSPEFWRASFKTGGSPGADDKRVSDGKTNGLLTVYPNYPNPFINTTTIRYNLLAYAHVTVTIYSSSGHKIVTLEDRNKNAGSFTVGWDGKNNAGTSCEAGLYFFSVKAENSLESREVNYKMLKMQ